MHPIARFVRFAVADPVRQHDEKLGLIEWLIFPEKFTAKFWPNKLRAAARRPVHDQYGVARLALRVLLRFPERPIVQPQLWQRLARGELEIANSKIAFRRRRIIGGPQCAGQCEQGDERQMSKR